MKELAAVTSIQQQFGNGSLMRMDAQALPIEVINSGAPTLNRAVGIGGIPRGRITEIYGPESTGKTTLVYHILANAQKKGEICAFIDAEHALDPAYAAKIGVKVPKLYVSQPDYGEQALEIASILIASGDFSVVAIDSIAALVPRAELDGEMGEQRMGLQARMMSQAMRKLAGNLHKTGTLLCVTNQLRSKIGISFGSNETTSGGRALKFSASLRLDLRKIGLVKQGDEIIGSRVRAKVVKNKLSAPYRTAEYDLDYGLGISREGCLLDLGVEEGLITKSGSYMAYGGQQLGQGRAKAKTFLREHPEIADKIESDL